MTLTYDPNLDITPLSLDWLIDAQPVLTWTPNPACAFVAVFRSGSSSWSSSSLLAKLGPDVSSYTDFTAEIGGDAPPPYFWWVIGFDATGAFAGRCAPVAGWQFSVSGNPPDDTTDDLLTISPPQITIDAIGGGHYRSQGGFSFSTCIAGDAYLYPPGQPGSPTPDYIGLQIFHSSHGGTNPENNIAATPTQDALTKFSFVAVGPFSPRGTPIQSPGSPNPAVTAPSYLGFPHSDPVPAAYLITGSSLAPSEVLIGALLPGADAPKPNAEGQNIAGLFGQSVFAKVSYFSAPGGSRNSGQGDVGGGGVSPTPTPLFPYNPPVTPGPTPSTPPTGRKRSASAATFSANRLGLQYYPVNYPAWLPRTPQGDFAQYFFDFQNGNYWLNGVIGQASDALDSTTQIIAGTGLKYTTTPPPSIIGPALTYLLAQSWTVVVDVDISAYVESYLAFISLTDATDTNELSWRLVDVSSSRIAAQMFGPELPVVATLNAFAPTTPMPSPFKTAMTSIPKASFSICCAAGSAVQRTFISSILVPATSAMLFDFPTDTYAANDAIFRSIAIYPPQPDSELRYLTS